jgi:diguanylate cyclase (GGDEF)-like protein
MPHFEHTMTMPPDEWPAGRAASAGGGAAAGAATATGDPEKVSDSLGKPTLRSRWSSVRNTKLLIYGVCAVLLALNGWFVYLSWVYTKRQVITSGANLSQSVSQQINASLLDVEHVLDDVVFECERTGLGSAAMDRLRPSLVNKTRKVEQITGLFVYDSKGHWLASSITRQLKGQNNADRDYFIFHQQSQSLQTQISSPVISRTTGEWVIPMSRRLSDPHGNFMGVAIATVRLNYLRRMIEKIDVGTEGAISLTLNGKLMVRKPYVEEFINKEVLESPMVQMAAKQDSGLSEQRSPYDGVMRLMNFTLPKDYPVIVTIARGKDEVFREWRQVAILLTVVIFALCAVVMLAGRYIVSSLRIREEAETKAVEAQATLDQANRQLMSLAFNDGLTGIPNRRYFDIRFKRDYRSAQRHARSLAVVMIDVDEFKKFNDHYGHGAGDACLRHVAQLLRSVANRPDDFLARYGGEEFVLLLPDTDLEGATRVAEEARAAVFDAGIPHEVAAHQRVTLSLGVATLVPTPSGIREYLLKAADEALYRAKQQGRNCAATANPALTHNIPPSHEN